LTILNSRALNGSVANSMDSGKSVYLSESDADRRQPLGRFLSTEDSRMAFVCS